MIESVVEEKIEVEKPVDREKICPFLLRIFLKNNRHHSLNDFTRAGVPANEVQLFTWMDATLQELTCLVKEANPDTRKKGTYFHFAVIYPCNYAPGYRMREIGSTYSGRKSEDDTKTLAACRYVIGDYIDVAVHAPSENDSNRRKRRR